MVTKLNSLIKHIKLLWRNTLFGYLESQISPDTWSISEKNLFDLNKTLITLSSSALVLSFSAIQIGNPILEKVLILWTWVMFLLVIIIGTILIFIKFLRSIAYSIVEINYKNGKYKGANNKRVKLPDELLLSREFNFVYSTQSLMYLFSILQITFFTTAFIFLIVTAYSSI